MPFEFKELKIPGVKLIRTDSFPDGRGVFSEFFRLSEFRAAGITAQFAQVNRSRSARNVLRGLHYQLNPRAQAKLVGVLRGEIFDAAVDMRAGSPSFGRFVSARLSEENKSMLYIPEGFAHGLCSLADDTEVVYLCSREYDPNLERCIIWNDDSIKIPWPVKNPLLSEKDSRGVPLSEAENNFRYTLP